VDFGATILNRCYFLFYVMKRGKYLLVVAVLLLLVLGSIFVFSSGHIIQPGFVERGALEESNAQAGQSEEFSIVGFVFQSPLNVDSVYYAIGRSINSVRGDYQRVAGVSHSAGEVERAIYSDYLRVNAIDNNGQRRFRLFGINEFRQATYVVPLISGATCNDMCKFTLGGQCKGVVSLSGESKWIGSSFDSSRSDQQEKLVLAEAPPGNNRRRCGLNYGDITLAAMCFCGS